MEDLLVIIAGVVLLVVAYVLYNRQRERVLEDRLRRAGRDASAAIGVMDQAIKDERARAEIWKKQNPHGGL